MKVKALEPLQLNDALKSEPVYDVVGAATDHVERNAATDVTDPETPSNKRAVRLLLYRWRPEKGDTPVLSAYCITASTTGNPLYVARPLERVLLLSDDGNRLLECVARMPSDLRSSPPSGSSTERRRVEALLISAHFSGGTWAWTQVSLTVSHQKLRALFLITTALPAIGGGTFTMALRR